MRETEVAEDTNNVKVDFADENAFATGVLMDIMMSSGSINCHHDDEDHLNLPLSSSWSPTATQTTTTEMPEMSSLDVSALDEYLTGNDSSFMDDSFMTIPKAKRKTGKKRSKRKKEKDEKREIRLF